MKKSFFASLLTAASIAVGAITVAAAEPPPKPAVPPARLEEAKERYVERGIAGLDVGLRIAKKPGLSPEQLEKVRPAFRKWVDDELVPFLTRNDLLNDWIEMQFDKDVERLHLESLHAANLGDVLTIAQETVDLTRKRWPKVVSKMGTPEWHQLQQSLQVSMMRILEEK